MPENKPPGSMGEAAAAAFARVLDAERAAEEAVAACMQEADRRRTQARAVGETLTASVDARILAWRRRLTAAVAGEIAECDCQLASLAVPCALDAATDAAIARAVARLADELIAGD